MDNMSEPKDVFQAVKWNRSEGHFPISPLQEEDTTHISPEDKASFLVQSLLHKAAVAEDIEPSPPMSHPSPLPFPPIEEHEVKQAIFSPKNSTPGQDNIPISILKKAWPCLGGAITTLYHHCLELGWHPSPFQQATLVALPKPGKQD